MPAPTFLGATEYSLGVGTHNFSLSDAPAGSDLVLIWFNSGNQQATFFVGVTWLGLNDGSDGGFYDPELYDYACQWLYHATKPQLAGGTSFEVDLPVTAVVLGYRTAAAGSQFPASITNNNDQAQLALSTEFGTGASGGNLASPYSLFLGMDVTAEYTMALQFVSSRTTPTPTTSLPDVSEIYSAGDGWIGEALDLATGTETVGAQRFTFGSAPRTWFSFWFVLFDGPSYNRGRRGLGLIR